MPAQKQKQKQSLKVVVNVGTSKLRRNSKRRVRAPPRKGASALQSTYQPQLTRAIRYDVPASVPYPQVANASAIAQPATETKKHLIVERPPPIATQTDPTFAVGVAPDLPRKKRRTAQEMRDARALENVVNEEKRIALAELISKGKSKDYEDLGSSASAFGGDRSKLSDYARTLIDKLGPAPISNVSSRTKMN